MRFKSDPGTLTIYFVQLETRYPVHWCSLPSCDITVSFILTEDKLWPLLLSLKNPTRKGTDKRAFLKRLHGVLNQLLESTETDEPAPIKLEVNCVLINKGLPGVNTVTQGHMGPARA